MAYQGLENYRKDSGSLFLTTPAGEKVRRGTPEYLKEQLRRKQEQQKEQGKGEK